MIKALQRSQCYNNGTEVALVFLRAFPPQKDSKVPPHKTPGLLLTCYKQENIFKRPEPSQDQGATTFIFEKCKF